MLFVGRRIKDLEEEVTKLKRMVEDRDLDWVDMRSRCKRLLDRTEKAAKALQPDDSVEGSWTRTSKDGEGTRTSTGRALSERQMVIQQQVLRRRAGG